MSDRYAQCDDTCTVDCGACKAAGRPMTAADADRAKAAELVTFPGRATAPFLSWDGIPSIVEAIAAALAAERAAAVERDWVWEAALDRLADEMEVTASRYEHAVAGSHDAGARNAHRIIAARHRAVVADTRQARHQQRGGDGVSKWSGRMSIRTARLAWPAAALLNLGWVIYGAATARVGLVILAAAWLVVCAYLGGFALADTRAAALTAREEAGR